MNHVVYLDSKANEMEKILANQKTMIIRGAMGRRVPYGKVEINDILYLINNNAEGKIRAVAEVVNVINSEKMDKKKSLEFVKKYQAKLQLTENQFKRWSGKRYSVLIEFKNVKEIIPFQFNRDNFKNSMDDWLIFDKIEEIKK
jgi:hypothetical protein